MFNNMNNINNRRIIFSETDYVDKHKSYAKVIETNTDEEKEDLNKYDIISPENMNISFKLLNGDIKNFQMNEIQKKIIEQYLKMTIELKKKEDSISWYKSKETLLKENYVHLFRSDKIINEYRNMVRFGIIHDIVNNYKKFFLSQKCVHCNKYIINNFGYSAEPMFFKSYFCYTCFSINESQLTSERQKFMVSEVKDNEKVDATKSLYYHLFFR